MAWTETIVHFYCDSSFGESYWLRSGHLVFCVRQLVLTGYFFVSPECVPGALCQGLMAADRETCLSVAEFREAASPHIYISWYLHTLLRLTKFRKFFLSVPLNIIWTTRLTSPNYMLKYVCIKGHSCKKARERTPESARILFFLRFNQLHKPAKSKARVNL